ncbi:MAG TPA: reverse transcriptase/maturase family protein [Candidatus Saccharimonadales bacterium]|nr:reverse transcriptase/maturase family protein [Candidatus Saccharimonadales bacterium]
MRFVISHKYEEIISLANLLLAWEEFAREKKNRIDVRIFSKTLLRNITSLHRDLTSNTYHHSSYEAFNITDPKPRHIHKATVRDRLLHRALHRILYPAFDETFIHDSYSCRSGKGTHKAFERLVYFARKISRNYAEPCWALKMDIRKFFDSIDHKILFNLLKRRIDDPDLLYVIYDILKSFEHSYGKGLPLGNLTSQLFANIYMDPLDKFVKHKLKVKYYLRYADDFTILSQNPDELMGYFIEINTFLKTELKLQIHPAKITLRKLNQGIDFVGYIALPHYQIPRRKTVRRIFKNVRKLSHEELEKSLPSYCGYLSHVSSRGLVGQLEAEVVKKIYRVNPTG